MSTLVTIRPKAFTGGVNLSTAFVGPIGGCDRRSDDFHPAHSYRSMIPFRLRDGPVNLKKSGISQAATLRWF